MTASGGKDGRGLPGWLGVVLAIVITVTVVGLLRTRHTMQAVAPPSEPLTVDTVDFRLQDSYRRPLSYLGLIVSGRKANLGFEIAGRIADLPYRQGSPVEAGQVIARLDDSSLLNRQEAARASLKQVEAELELARLKARRQLDLRETGAVSREAVDETRELDLGAAEDQQRAEVQIDALLVEVDEFTTVAKELVIDTAVSHVDLFPTILDAVGVAVAQLTGFEGGKGFAGGKNGVLRARPIYHPVGQIYDW